VLKDAEPEFLLAAIRTVHAGTAVIAPSATQSRSSTSPTGLRSAQLTPISPP
jgi:DNA-binding NarL/FixJ family response regulator